MSAHHAIEVHPIPEKALFINEPQFADQTAPGDGILSGRGHKAVAFQPSYPVQSA